MRLLINTASALKGGSVQVASSLLRECVSFDDYEFGVILGPGLSDLIQDHEFPTNFRFFRLDYRPAQRVFSLRGSGSDLEKIESVFKPNVVFTTSGPSYWRPKVPHLMGFNLPHHLYPDSPYFTQVLNPFERARWWWKSRFVLHYTKRFADAWVVQTDDVNQRLRRWISSEDVYTVSNTVGEVFLAAKSEDHDSTCSKRERSTVFRLLVLSSYYRHKNLEILNDVIGLLRQEGIRGLRFTMTLPEKDFKKALSPKNRAWVDNIGPQDPKDCPTLYQHSDALFLPTLLECFSANYAEAMAMGLPIITTDLGFARTICSGAALYFTPLDGQSAARTILKLREDEGLRRRLLENGRKELKKFGTPGERATKYLEICRRLATSGFN